MSSIISSFLNLKSTISDSETEVKMYHGETSITYSNNLNIELSEYANTINEPIVKISKGNGKITLRNYQIELTKNPINKKNSIICCPTGSGKTFIVGQILKKLHDECLVNNRPFKAVFLVCQRILVKQQMDALVEFFKGTTESNQSTIRICKGGDDHFQLSEVFIHYDIVVMTGQIFMNSIKYSEHLISELSLIVFDECHHTDLKHVYNVIMLKYLEIKFNDQYNITINNTKIGKNILPQILGITATLGVGDSDDENEIVEHYIKMCANLDCKNIEYVRNNEAELKMFSPQPNDDIIIKCQPKALDEPFGVQLLKILKEIENLAFPEFDPIFAPGTQKYENEAVLLKKNSECTKMFLGFIAEVLITLNQACMIFLDFSAQDSYIYLLEYFENKINFHEKMDENREAIYDLWKFKRENLRRLANEETINKNPKLKELEKLLRSKFDENPKSMGILLTRTKKSVDIFLEFLELKEICKPAKLVGHSEMTDAEQEATIKNFKQGGCNLFVATDVAQEGLDLPACNFVIRYNFVSNEIGSVQARGRARTIQSSCYLIIDKNSPDLIRELKNRVREIKMREALKIFDSKHENIRNELIINKQKYLFTKYKLSQMQKSDETKIDGKSIEIVCKNCKLFLCFGNQIKIRGSNYVCIKELKDFGKDLRIEKIEGMSFKTESHIGTVFCNGIQCNEKLGRVLKYSFGREYSFKFDAIVYRILSNEEMKNIQKTNSGSIQQNSSLNNIHENNNIVKIYKRINKWSKSEFQIDEIPLFNGKFLKMHFTN